MKWISVKDRLPNNIPDVVAWRAASGEFRIVWWQRPLFASARQVTHWMPLTPPPTAEDDAARENRAET